MKNTSHLRGHLIEFNGEEWVYSDTKESTILTWTERACGVCNKFATEDGHDACLGTLSGVINACCGHGDIGEAYIMLDDRERTVLRGENALHLAEKLKSEKKESESDE